MKYCTRPFEHMYVDFNGQARFCSWTSGEPLGNIQDGVETVWNSERAYAFRAAILQGDFSYCRSDVCPYIMNNTLPDNMELKMEDILKPFPEMIQLAYDYQCNLSCPSCRNKPIVGSSRSEKFFSKMKLVLLPYLNKAKMLDFGGHGDPFFSKHSLSIMESLCPERSDFKLSIQSNGLCFSREVWRRIQHLSNYHISLTISIDSLNPIVYAKLRRGGNLKTLLKNIEMMAGLKKEGHINNLHAVMVVQDINFMEIRDFLEYCFSHGFDGVQLENLYNWGTFNEKEYFAKNLLNPQHPNHKFYKDILAEVLKDPRVRCWAGNTNRISNNWVVTGQSKFAVCEIAEADCIDLSSNLDQLSHAIWNKDYIFVVDKGLYQGTITYNKFHSYMGTANCVNCGLDKLFDEDITPLEYQNLEDIFLYIKNITSPCKAVPILKKGKLILKALMCE